jgi:hypothetical protein
MNNSAGTPATETLKAYKVDGTALYLVGTFDTGVTVFSQQTRALNLAWAAVESELVPTTPMEPSDTITPQCKIAIVGAGFAGLSVAAGLISKGSVADITIFEQRDTLLPLQQGSDSRWLHPRIYDWPREGSQASVAMLPVLNWTAARASDVVVQVLSEWKKTLRGSDINPTLYCNTRHLQIHECGDGTSRVKLEWVGEKRTAIDGTTEQDSSQSNVGRSDTFDLVILAIGFGVERDGALSYWRNETMGQPSLDQPRRTFLVSGQGDGAMIDVLRLRISQYRQDRILEELFNDKKSLLSLIQRLHTKYTDDEHRKGLFADFEALERNEDTNTEFEGVIKQLSRRLRRDTDVILHLQVRNLSQLLDPPTSRISFQNKILIFFLYKCGGFVPSTLDEEKLIKQHAVHKGNIVRRHGTYRDDQLSAILSDHLYRAIKTRRGDAKPDPFSQPDRARWPGGYFDFRGKSQDSFLIEDNQRAHWRKEYLPGPTELMATAFCATLAGLICSRHTEPGRLRVTLHRAISFGDEELLQQACDYQGTDTARGAKTSAARTFPANNGTIGIAYRSRKIVRSVSKIAPTQLSEAMDSLQLNEASRKMSSSVKFVLAIPLLEPGNSLSNAPSVTGVIYIDSEAENFFIANEELGSIVNMATELLNALTRANRKPFDRIRNIETSSTNKQSKPIDSLPQETRDTLELVTEISPPQTNELLNLNFDYSDFSPAIEENNVAHS